MKIDAYVKQTLLDIAKGVEAAKREADVLIAPGFMNDKIVSTEQLIRFEIAITVSGSGEGGVKVFSLADIKTNAEYEKLNKVSFSVPIYFQAPTEPSDQIE